MDTSTIISDCALILDQARSLLSDGRTDEAKQRARKAYDECRRWTAHVSHDDPLRVQLNEVLAACEAMLHKLESS